MSNRFDKLRGAMAVQRVTGTYLAPRVGLSKVAFSRKLNEASEFTLKEAYAILELLGIPHSEIYQYFPEEGR